MVMPANGGRPEVLNAAPSEDHVAKDWSSDGRYILYSRGAGFEDGAAGTTDLSLYDLQAGTSRIVAPGVDGMAALSPDGRWVAYNSGEYGLNQVYVASLSGTSRWQISSSQGRRPVWHRDGRQIAFQRG
jgi:Tol biopolymer transport system component